MDIITPGSYFCPVPLWGTLGFQVVSGGSAPDWPVSPWPAQYFNWSLTFKGIVDQLIRYGKVTRPILGISFAPDQAAAQLGVDGVLVLDAPPGGPAARAGVQPTRRDRYGRLDLGDVVTSIDGEKISGAADLYKVLDRLQPGQTIKLGLQRKEGSQELQVTLDSS